MSLLSLAVFGALFSHVLEVCSVTCEWVSVTVALRVPLGLVITSGICVALGVCLGGIMVLREHLSLCTWAREWEWSANGAL